MTGYRALSLVSGLAMVTTLLFLWKDEAIEPKELRLITVIEVVLFLALLWGIRGKRGSSV